MNIKDRFISHQFYFLCVVSVTKVLIAGTGSDSDLDQLERLKAELMAKLEGDFKLSPEEDTDSEGISPPKS